MCVDDCDVFVRVNVGVVWGIMGYSGWWGLLSWLLISIFGIF